MALAGKIVDFGVADILQLISQQQKTGILIVEHDKESAEIVFWNGMILAAHSGTQSESEALSHYLHKCGLVSELQLQEALEIQETRFRHLGEILVELGAMEREVLDKVLHNKIYDIFSEIFQWREGNYVFNPKTIDFNEKIFSPLGLEHILLDVLRMIDEWPAVVKKIPSMTMIFKKVDRATPKVKEELSYEQMVVYQLVDGCNTVQDIVDKSLLGKFTASKSLMELAQAGSIEVVLERRSVATEGSTGGQLIAERVLLIGSSALIVFLVIVLVLFSPPDPKSIFSLFFTDPPASVLIRLDQNRLQKIKNALQVFFWEKGKYPTLLQELVETRILHNEEIARYQGMPFEYRSSSTAYELR